VKSAAIAMPGVAWGSYPERDAKRPSVITQQLSRFLAAPNTIRVKRHRSFLGLVHSHANQAETYNAGDFAAAVRKIKAYLAAEGFVEQRLAEAFALVREATRRSLDMTQYDTQLIAARVMLDNQLAEMATGEGKTLAALLTAATAAMSGIPVHVMTANDYLVARDAENLKSVYNLLGLSVGYVTQASTPEQRRAAYACDITYCTAKELVFDYLRDRLAFGQRRDDLQRRIATLNDPQSSVAKPLLRGLCMALVDEADSILIDEARTPLILSEVRANEQHTAYLDVALELAASLVRNRDFQLHSASRSAELTLAGRALLADKVSAMSGVWRDRRRREEAVTMALAARHSFKRDRDYLVRDGKVVIVDETTGRVAEGRVWSRGLQQFIERKEGCEPSGEQRTIAQITYQRVFPRYLRLCGMSGTLHEARGELHSVYGLRVTKIPLQRPSKRTFSPVQLFATSDAKWNRVTERIQAMRALGRPVLVGTDSVADSERLSERLGGMRIPHAVLNARHDAEEAMIVERAGEAGQITIATNMAGRGTDIAVPRSVTQRGGLHIICCQHNGARRIDRQLHGRCARRGDPGSVETILSVDDPLIDSFLPNPIKTFIRFGLRRKGLLAKPLAQILLCLPQIFEERRQWLQRWQLLQQDSLLDRRLSFGGKGE
jgi:preprotein translocase subunit SecA